MHIDRKIQTTMKPKKYGTKQWS